MYKNHKVVCCTAAGRRKYMQYIFPYIVSSPVVDRYDIWVNTVNMEDIEFFEKMAKRYPKVNLVMQPDGIVDGIKSINAFYKFCQEPGTIYMKIDDDVVWMESDIFEKMAEFRLSHPDSFLVSPMVINNAMCSYVWQVQHKMNFGRYMNAASNHRIMWKRGAFAAQLHQKFIDRQKTEKDFYKKLYVLDTPWAANRLSINFIVWTGEQMQAMNGIVPGDDEEYLSCIRPTELGQMNMLNGNAIIAHFSFGPQNEELDRMNILQQYGEILKEEFALVPEQKECFEYEQALFEHIGNNTEHISKKTCPYKVRKHSRKDRLKKHFKRFQKKARTFVDRQKSAMFEITFNV